ncbi:MAG TPA: hypothetical protein VMF53_14395 [Alphaproteobacteria bacterium]|nr:hypothetical protein [Alphaproteobacteria bacterium]
MDQNALEETVRQFRLVLEAAGEGLPARSILGECTGPPHRQPTSQPEGRPGIYAFFYQKHCLKCGQVGPNSAARYTSQHYNPKSSKSNLAATLLIRGTEIGLSAISDENIGDWIKTNTARANVLLPNSTSKRVLNFAEAFFHLAWKPVFEGREWRDWLNIL